MNPRAFLGRIRALVRDAWLVLGLALALAVALELAYRAQGAARRVIRDRGPDAVRLETVPWAAEYEREFALAHRGMGWAPWVYIRLAPFRGRAITVDSLGRRRTVPAVPQARRRVFAFGGSTMWGTYQADSATIPSRMAARLAACGLDDVELVNFGESGRTVFHELIELQLQLRDGARPDAVVFYDGINDGFAAFQNGVPGLPQNEHNRSRDFHAGRVLNTDDGSLRTELRAGATLIVAAARRSQLMRRLWALRAP